MARARISTTVDTDLLDRARRARADANDAELVDEALGALLANDRAAEIDAAYAAAPVPRRTAVSRRPHAEWSVHGDG
jgi:hypothetical protein